MVALKLKLLVCALLLKHTDDAVAAELMVGSALIKMVKVLPVLVQPAAFVTVIVPV